MKLRLFNYNYYNIFDNPYDRDLECPILVLCCREKDGSFHMIRVPGRKGIFRPHFFVEDTEKNRKSLEVLKEERVILDWSEWDYPAVYDEEERVLVVYAQYPYEVKNLKENFEHTYQADINYDNLFIIMLGLDQGYFEIPDGKEWVEPEEIVELPEEEHFYVEPRIFYFDIETDFIDARKGFDIDNQEIISIVVYDNYEDIYHLLEWSYKNNRLSTEKRIAVRKFMHPEISTTSEGLFYHCISEKQMLEIFFNLFKKNPDGLFGFNSHGGNVFKSVKSKTERVWRNGFDEPVIYKRAIKLGLQKEMQLMSPLPDVKNAYGNYYGVYHRGRNKKLEVVTRGLTPLDFHYAEPLMKYTEKYRDFFGRSLDAYLKRFSNFHKIKHEGLTVAQLKRIDLEKELLYNKVDVEGCLFLDKRFGFSKDVFDTIALSLIHGIDILSATRIHNFLTFKESKDHCVYDTKYQSWYRDLWEGWLEEKKDEYEITMKSRNMAGGYNVKMQKKSSGITAVFDFSAFYPTLAVSANAGIDTLIQVEREFKNHYRDKKGKRWHKSQCIITPTAPFRKDKDSIEKRIWGKLLGFKAKYKKLYNENFKKYVDPNHPQVKLYWSKVYNLKGRLINNKYGASGNKGYKMRSLPVYNAPPTLSQCCLRGIERELLPSLGYNAKAGDTDSIMVGLKSKTVRDAMKECDDLVVKLNEFIDIFLKREFNIDENTVDIGWEKIASSFYGHKAKNYAMKIVAEDGEELPEDKQYIVYKGFTLKKQDRSDVTEMVQKIYLDIALENLEQDVFLSKITDFIKRIEKIFPFLDWTKICSRINVRKNLNEYPTNYFSKRAAEFANETLGCNYGAGSHGFFAYLDMNGNGGLDPVVMFNREDIRKFKKLGYKIDYKIHKQKFVINKLNLLLDDYDTDYNTLLKRDRIKSPFVI